MVPVTLKLNRKEDATPLHLQLSTYYRERILDGRLPAGTRLPTELELTAEHQISRDTVRQALAQLVSEGLLERVPRRGTFVRGSLLIENTHRQTSEKRIGLVLNRPPTSQLNMDILIGVEQTAKSRGYHVIFTYAAEDQEQQDRDIARLRADHVMGLLIFPVSDSTSDESIRQLQIDNIPFGLIDRSFPDLDADFVGSDNSGGAYRATEHLLILGHTRIGFVHSHLESLLTSSVHDRWEGYCQALEKYHIPYDETLIVPNAVMSQVEAQRRYAEFLARPDRPDAIFAVNDLVALDVIHAAQRCGLRIPEDVALVGFDDLSFAAHLRPALTTVAQSLMDVGARAADLLINRIEGQVGPPKHIVLPTDLIVRESCGAQLRIRRLASL
jgi:GntR family transcriptional regulator of arabinose operon